MLLELTLHKLEKNSITINALLIAQNLPSYILFQELKIPAELKIYLQPRFTSRNFLK